VNSKESKQIEPAGSRAGNWFMRKVNADAFFENDLNSI
jgi:hypothetical protein